MGSGTQTDLALICHWPHDKAYWLDDALRKRGFCVTRFSRKWKSGQLGEVQGRVRSYVDALRLGAWAAWFADRHGTVVVASEGGLAGVFAAIVPPVKGLHRRPVLCTNLILYDRPGMTTSLRKLLYRLALRNPRIIFTVSSGSLRQHYAALLRADPGRFLVLSDCYAPGHRSFAQHDPTCDGGYVFAGGDAARDWPTTIAVAQACPEIPFHFVALRRTWPDLAVPPNVQLEFDVPLADFWEATRNARLVLVLLTNDVVTAGLIVVTHAALMGSTVIASRTAATEGYFPPANADLLVPMGDAERVVGLVRYYWNDAEARQRAAERLQHHVMESYSPEAYSTVIADTIRRLQEASAPQDQAGSTAP